MASGRRFPFGLPRTGNANHRCIQVFHSALNEQGRAGFVMAKSTRNLHSCSVKVIEDVRKDSAEQGLSGEQTLRGGQVERPHAKTWAGLRKGVKYVVWMPRT